MLRLINQCLCEETPQKALTMFLSMPYLADCVQIQPDLLQCAVSADEICCLVDVEHSYAFDVLDSILVNVIRLNNEQQTVYDVNTVAVDSYS